MTVIYLIGDGVDVFSQACGMKATELDILDFLTKNVMKSLKNYTHFTKKVGIYLQAGPTICLQRTNQRGRMEEKYIELKYLRHLDELYRT